MTGFDVIYSRDTFGAQAASREPNRAFSGVIQPAGDNLTKLLPEGAQSDGAMVLHTASPISAATNTQDTENNTQTYIIQNGNYWKAWAVQDWQPHQKIARYLLTRYLNVDELPA